MVLIRRVWDKYEVVSLHIYDPRQHACCVQANPFQMTALQQRRVSSSLGDSRPQGIQLPGPCEHCLATCFYLCECLCWIALRNH